MHMSALFFLHGICTSVPNSFRFQQNEITGKVAFPPEWEITKAHCKLHPLPPPFSKHSVKVPLKDLWHESKVFCQNEPHTWTFQCKIQQPNHFSTVGNAGV